MDKKKRIAIAKKNGLTMKLEFEYVTDQEFEDALKKHEELTKMPAEDFITYTLGAEDEMNEGTLYFCPRCGEYNEYGFEPNVTPYYNSADKKLAGFFKRVDIECMNCDENYEIHNSRFDEDMKKMNEKLE